MNYTTYLFDFDYTLADSSRGIVTCFRNVLTRHGYTEVTDDDIKRTIGKTLEDSFSILTGVTDAGQLAGFKAEYRKEADTHMTVNTVLFSGNQVRTDCTEGLRRSHRNHLDQISIPHQGTPRPAFS